MATKSSAPAESKSSDAHAPQPTASTVEPEEKLNDVVPSVGPDDPQYHKDYQKTQQQLAQAQRPSEEGDEDAEPVLPYDEKGSFRG